MSNLEKDLQRAAEIMLNEWSTQNDQFDKRTNFIYRSNSLEDCLIQIERTHVDKNYALHRWYNFKTSIICEQIFCEYGAVHSNDPYDHDVDIYIYRRYPI